MKREVVVTGMGAVTPLGVGATSLYERWRDGDCGIVDGTGRAGDFEPTEHLSVKEARRADRFSQFAIVAGDEAVRQAGWADELPYDNARVGVIVGTGIGGMITMERGKDLLEEFGPKKVPPLSVPLMMGNAAAASLSMRYRLRGPSHGVLSACSAGADGIGTAVRMIQIGDADAAVTGGTEAALTSLSHASFAALDALSDSGISMPFDARRDGFVMGEGAGILVIEDGEKARARGATILGRIRGYGASSDAFHITAPDDTGGGPASAVLLALEDAELTPEDIVYVNAHGTSTPLNDRAETLALKRALGDARAHKIPTSSTKSAIGHLLGAAGAVEAIATILALRDGMAPPTLGYEVQEEGLDLDYVPGKSRPLDVGEGPRYALSNSFGFGGHNAVLCLEAS